jgi:Acyl-CoA synthetases (AMP-forming)/AMP-acid ligases II
MSLLTDHLKQKFSKANKSIIKEGENWKTTDNVKNDIECIWQSLKLARIRRGDKVLLGLPNSYSFIVTYLAIIEYGAVVVPVNPDMPLTELLAYLARCHPVCACLTEQKSADLLDQKDNIESLKMIFSINRDPLKITAYKWTQAVWAKQTGAETGWMPVSAPADDDIAVLLYTSGTTGRPKGVALSHRQIYAAARNIIQSHKLDQKDIVYSFLPLFHINAQVVGLISTCLSGGQLIIAPKFSASVFWHVINREHVTWVSAVPAVISILLRIEKPKSISPSLRFVRSASAPLPRQHAREFEARFGIPLIESYGMTEAASQICVNPVPPEKRVLGSVGRPAGLSLKIVDDHDRPQPLNRPGEIAIRGDNVVTRYVAADNQDDFRHGWFHTGDIGYLNEDGFVFIIGRKKEIINRGGEKISPYEIEDIIRQIPAVRQVAVIGQKDPMYGEQVAAYVIPQGKAVHLKDQIRAYCRQNLSDFKCPATIEMVSELPTGPTGKIRRSLLKKQAGICGRTG